MDFCAQTNVQLRNHLRRLGYAESDLLAVHLAYELALRLFTGQFEASGKPFLDHLVGTASILASRQQPITVVVAGLLHDAYGVGDFGTGRRGLSEPKRRLVRGVVGEEVEGLVARYATLPWGRRGVLEIARNLDRLDRLDRTVVTLRLANELEHHLELGRLYDPDAPARRRDIDDYLYLAVDIAGRLGLPDLAADLQGAFAETVSAELPDGPGSYGPSHFALGPTSHRVRLPARMNRFLSGPVRATAYEILGWRGGQAIERTVLTWAMRLLDAWALRPAAFRPSPAASMPVRPPQRAESS